MQLDSNQLRLVQKLCARHQWPELRTESIYAISDGEVAELYVVMGDEIMRQTKQLIQRKEEST